MDNINCQAYKREPIEEVELDTLKKDEVVQEQCMSKPTPCKKTCGLDSSLLFFFLILVCIVCQYDCDISMDILLMFFLLLVLIYNKY